ncbi:cob(I)yrinic acid a,c-diamide adenosyltransferase, partial [Mangrovimonas futianensis]
ATGREAAEDQITLADLVTEMREVKHPYAAGAPAKKGVEY